MTAHAAIAAVPKTGSPDRSLLQNLLVTRAAYVIGASEDPEAFDPRGENGDVVVQLIGYNGHWFWYDEADSTTGHDGETCIVTSATGGRYKVNGVDLLITHVISKTLTTPPDPDDVDEEERPSDGDAYIVPAAATGDWSTWENSIAVWSEPRREWMRILPKPGWFVWIAGDDADTAYHYDSVQAEWISGLGGGLSSENSVPLSAIIGCAASLTIRVQNQTTYAPPGSRKTGATPTMPLGGTASNINDDDDATSGVSSALGNLTGAAVGDRIVARLALAATTDLIAIEARGALGSATSSANAMGLYYSTDGGSSWTQAGSGFTLSTASQNVQRTGTFNGVTDIALITEAKNWASNTNELAGLNAYDATVVASVGDSYIIASNSFGIFSGQSTKLAVCEVEDSFAIYTPANGDRVFDVASNFAVQFNGSAWVSAGGTLIDQAFTRNRGTTDTGTGGTGSKYTYSDSAAPTTLHDHRREVTGILFTAKATGNPIKLDYQAEVTVNNDLIVVAVFRDNETNAIDWVPFDMQRLASNLNWVKVSFRFDALDADEHTYRVYVMYPTSGAVSAMNARLTELFEFAA